MSSRITPGKEAIRGTADMRRIWDARAKPGVRSHESLPGTFPIRSYAILAAMHGERLLTFPYVKVRIGCELCRRRGEYRLARLAAKFGAEISMGDLLARLTADCEARDARHPYRSRCVARFIDLDRRGGHRMCRRRCSGSWLAGKSDLGVAAQPIEVARKTLS